MMFVGVDHVNITSEAESVNRSFAQWLAYIIYGIISSIFSKYRMRYITVGSYSMDLNPNLVFIRHSK